MMKKVISTEKAPAAIGPYSQAIETGGTLYVSGQIPLNPTTGKLVEGGICEQTTQVLNNLKAILEAAGYHTSDVVKTTCLLANMDDFKDFNEIYSQTFTDHKPARATFGVVRLPLGALVEIDCIAVR